MSGSAPFSIRHHLPKACSPTNISPWSVTCSVSNRVILSDIAFVLKKGGSKLTRCLGGLHSCCLRTLCTDFFEIGRFGVLAVGVTGKNCLFSLCIACILREQILLKNAFIINSLI